jgi:hypothetical protein
MAMLIAWHTLNKLANPQDARFSDAFLIVTPGITIRDRLRVLLDATTTAKWTSFRRKGWPSPRTNRHPTSTPSSPGNSATRQAHQES